MFKTMKALGCIRDPNVWTALAWPLGLVAVAMFCSFVLACGMPFAAPSALAALALPLRTAITTAILGWLANQLVGFGLLTYPIDPVTLVSGLALGISTAAAAAVAAARLTLKLTARLPMVAASGLAFLTVLLTQQALVYPASWMLGSHPSAFALSVLWQIGWTNALAFIMLGLVYRLDVLAGLKRSASHQVAG